MRLSGIITAGLALAGVVSGQGQSNTGKNLRGRSEFYKSPSTDLASSNTALDLNQRVKAEKPQVATPQRRLEYVSAYPECRADESLSPEVLQVDYDSMYTYLDDNYSSLKAQFDSKLESLYPSNSSTLVEKLNVIFEFYIDNSYELQGLSPEDSIRELQNRKNCIDTRTSSPTPAPTPVPSGPPTPAPTVNGTVALTDPPSSLPTSLPSGMPSSFPTFQPTYTQLTNFDCTTALNVYDKRTCLEVNELFGVSGNAYRDYNSDFGLHGETYTDVYMSLDYSPGEMINTYRTFVDDVTLLTDPSREGVFNGLSLGCQNNFRDLIDYSTPSTFGSMYTFIDVCQPEVTTALYSDNQKVYDAAIAQKNTISSLSETQEVDVYNLHVLSEAFKGKIGEDTDKPKVKPKAKAKDESNADVRSNLRGLGVVRNDDHKFVVMPAPDSFQVLSDDDVSGNTTDVDVFDVNLITEAENSYTFDQDVSWAAFVGVGLASLTTLGVLIGICCCIDRNKDKIDEHSGKLRRLEDNVFGAKIDGDEAKEIRDNARYIDIFKNAMRNADVTRLDEMRQSARVKDDAYRAADAAFEAARVVNQEAKNRTYEAADTAFEAARVVNQEVKDRAYEAADNAFEAARVTNQTRKDRAYRVADNAFEEARGANQEIKDRAYEAADNAFEDARVVNQEAKDRAYQAADTAFEDARVVNQEAKDRAYQAADTAFEEARLENQAIKNAEYLRYDQRMAELAALRATPLAAGETETEREQTLAGISRINRNIKVSADKVFIESMVEPTRIQAEAKVAADTEYDNAMVDPTRIQTEAKADADRVFEEAMVDPTRIQTEAKAAANTAYDNAIVDLTRIQTEAKADADRVFEEVMVDPTRIQTEAKADADRVFAEAMVDPTRIQTEAKADADRVFDNEMVEPTRIQTEAKVAADTTCENENRESDTRADEAKAEARRILGIRIPDLDINSIVIDPVDVDGERGPELV